MPTKFDPEVWEDVRERMSALITKGVDAKTASVRVSRALKGKPAPGTIFNKYRDGWNSAPKLGAGLASQVKQLSEKLAQLEKRVDALTPTAEQDVITLIAERAKFQGQAEAMKDALMLVETGQNGIPIGGEDS